MYVLYGIDQIIAKIKINMGVLAKMRNSKTSDPDKKLTVNTHKNEIRKRVLELMSQFKYKKVK